MAEQGHTALVDRAPIDQTAGAAVFAGAARAISYIEQAPDAPPVLEHPTDASPLIDETIGREQQSDAAGRDTDLSRILPETDQIPASTGFRGLLVRAGVRVGPGRAERARREEASVRIRDEEVIRQATWTRAVSILVANRKGGTGKTPIALLLGGILASIRGGSVAILEVSDDPGALTFRAEGTPARGLGELVRDVQQITSAGRLAGYTAPQTSFASVIGTVGHRPRLTGEDVIAVSRVVDEFYSIRVMDSGNQPSSSAFHGAVTTADALVVPVLNAGDAVLEAVATLEEMGAAGGKAAELAERAILLRLTDGRPEHPQVRERIDRIIESMHLSQVHEIPYDRHIAERGQLTLAKLQPATAAALTAATSGVIRTLQTAVH
jgi:MinD-like ATPase involved in chromosome partitioning or flagellar assembly